MAGARRFLKTFLAVAAGLVAAVACTLFVVDPYDRGHGPVARPGTVERGPRTANVSRGRNPAFNAAIIGNSHVQLLNPDRLNTLTGFRFVQLTVPGTTPREQLAMLEWFALHHRQTLKDQAFKAVILGLDNYWCTAKAALPVDKPFPFWLYDTSDRAYFPELFRLKSLQSVPRRIAFLLGRAKAQRADGFWDYEALRTRNETYFRKEVVAMRRPGVWNESGQFPAAQALADALGKLPPHVRVSLVIPPIFIDALPDPGSSQAKAERACVAAFARIANSRPNTSLVDARQDSPLLRDSLNFWDSSHYTRNVAEIIEADIARGFEKN